MNSFGLDVPDIKWKYDQSICLHLWWFLNFRHESNVA